MEQNPSNSTIITIPADPNHPHHDEQPAQIRTQKRKNGLNVIKVALFMMRGRSRKPTVLPVGDDDGSKSMWRKLVGSMRPLHLQSTQSPRSSSSPSPFTPQSPSEYGGALNDFSAEEELYSPSPPSSRYASAVGLSELVQSDVEDNERQEVIVEEEEEEEEECNEQKQGDGNGNGDGDGDEMIDTKADEFIAKFYQQMKLQRLNTADRQYQERSHRSLGWWPKKKKEKEKLEH